MAQVDTSIYSNMLRPPKSVAEYDAERMQGQSNKLALMLGQQKADEYTRSLDDAAQERGIVSGFGADKEANYNALLKGGRLTTAQKYAEQNAATGEMQGKIHKQKVDLIDAKLKQSRAFLDTVTTPEQYIAWHEGNHQDADLGPELAARGITAEQARASIMEAIGKPGGFEEMLNKSKLGVEKFTEMNKPTIHTQNLGGTSQISAIPGMGGAPTVLSNTPITQDANSIASNNQSNTNSLRTAGTAAAGRAQSERASIRSDSRAREFNSLKSEENRQKTQAGKAPTEFQGKSATFGSRAAASDKIITQLGESYSPTAINTKQGLGKVWGVGGALEAGANLMLGDNSQKAEQAQRDFINAVLRQESGAAIADSEFANAKKQYFPQPGDSKAVITQKAQNRKLSIQGFLNNAGRAAIPSPADAGDGWSMEEVK